MKGYGKFFVNFFLEFKVWYVVINKKKWRMWIKVYCVRIVFCDSYNWDIDNFGNIIVLFIL